MSLQYYYIITVILITFHITSCLSLSSSSTSRNKTPAALTNNDKDTHLIFPGGGIFFYWQAGVITYLREQKYNLIDNGTRTSNNNDNDNDNNADNDTGRITFTGASAGALCATLTTANVDFEVATELALKKAEDAGVWDRPLGLQGVWGGMIEEWLDELLPEDSVEMVQDRLSLLVTEIPNFSKSKISQFENKNDLIRCNMASVHIPFFLNGKLTTDFRSKPHIDGSFLSKPEDYHQTINNNNVISSSTTGSSSSSSSGENAIVLDWQEDPFLTDRTLADAVTALSKDGIWDLLERGRSYAALMEKRGDFDRLLKSD